jgi:hypothetical protein
MLFGLRSFRCAATVLLALTFLAACSKDDADPDTSTPGISWTVDGTNVTAYTIDKVVSTTSIRLNAVAGTVSGSGSLILIAPKKAGTYILSPTSASTEAHAFYSASTSTTATPYEASAGSIVITTLTATNVTGTFTFTGDEMQGGSTRKVITNGKFNIAW